MKSFACTYKSANISVLRFIVLTFITLTPLSILAQEPSPMPDRLRVGVTEFPPYAIKTDDGKWTGLSVELWQAVARELDVAYDFKELNRVGQLIDAIQNGELDLIPLSAVTESNETIMDLSHSYHRSGLAIAVPRDGPGKGLIAFIKRFSSANTLKVLGVLLLLSLLAGVLIWLLESRKNREMFGGKFSNGIGHGIWWAMVTMTTVGYGDKAPQTVAGRVVAVIWMFFSIILITSYTAVITASFAVDELSGRIRGPRDLPVVRVGALSQSQVLGHLVNEGIPVLPFGNLQQGLQAVADNRIDAFVDEETQLKYLIKNDFQGKLNVLPETFDNFYVSMALPSNSPLREPLNRTLARILDGDEWIKLKERYLGRYN